MNLDIIVRDKERAQARNQTAKILKDLPEITGSLYLGYPDLGGPPPAKIDALLVDPKYGAVIFKLNEGEAQEDAHENLSQAIVLLQAELMKLPILRQDKRSLKVSVRACWVKMDGPKNRHDLDEDIVGCDLNSLKEVLVPQGSLLDDHVFAALQSVVQRSGSLRKPVPKPDKGQALASVLARIASEVSSFDRSQAHGALEMVDGPQRIRGLAGCGKTVVLARKAAELHRREPLKRIVVTYFTRSVSAILEHYIEDFLGDTPWNRSTLQILPAWGSRSNPGVYSLLCAAVEEPTLSVDEAKSRYGADNVFNGACLEIAKRWTKEPRSRVLWDYVLVDEAQDLPIGFFQMLWRATDEPHRIVWAYDELQTLFGESLPGPKDLFKADNLSLNLENRSGEAQKDVTLQVCYRTPPWVLVAAHAVGLGVTHAPEYAQWVERKESWEAVGYEVNGAWEPGKKARLHRPEKSAPSFFGTILKVDESFGWHTFDSVKDQDDALIQKILQDVQEGGLRPEQILVIFANSSTYKTRGARIQAILMQKRLGAQIAGESQSADVFSVPGSVTLAGVHRAKGNEAPRVYVIDAGVSDRALAKERSELFVAMTRSTAWLKVFGFGERMQRLAAELDQFRSDSWVMNVEVPTSQQLERLRRLGQDLSPAERKVLKDTSNLSKNVKELDDEQLARVLEREPALRDRLKRLLAQESKIDQH